MTDRIALILGLLLVAIFGVDHFVFQSQLAVFLGQKIMGFINFLEFWR